MQPKTDYDIALSFAGEQREYVQKVYEALMQLGMRPYYDEAEAAQTLGTNLVDHFSDIFGKKARFCAMFISKEYIDKPWTNFERQFIEERQLYEQGYIIPIRFDDSEIKGLPSTIGYVKAENYQPGELAQLLANKIKSPSSPPNKQEPKINYKQPRLKPRSFNVYKERDRWLETVLMELESRESDERLDVTIIRSGTPGIRVLLDGKTIWAVNFKYGGHVEDAGMSISASSRDTDLYNNSMNAFGSFAWDRSKNDTVFSMTDLSFLSDFGLGSEKDHFTAVEFANTVWEKIIALAEEHDK